MASRGLKEVPPPGTRVQLTGYFLKATGQQRGGEGSKKWKVVACSCPLCSRGDFVAVDEPTSEEELRTTYADIPKADREKHGILWRHINKANLQLVGKVPHSRDMSDAPELVAGKKSKAQLEREIDEALSKPKSSVSHVGRSTPVAGRADPYPGWTPKGPGSYLYLIEHPSDYELWFFVTEDLKNGGVRGKQVDWNAGDRKPKKAVTKTINKQWLDKWKHVKTNEMPPEVQDRFGLGIED